MTPPRTRVSGSPDRVKVRARRADTTRVQESLDAVTRCPRCRALVPDGVRWCTLCYSPLAGPLAPYDDEPPPAPDADAERSAEAMLAVLAAESGSPLGPLGGRLSSTQARVGLMVGGVVACTLLLFLVMWVVGALL